MESTKLNNAEQPAAVGAKNTSSTTAQEQPSPVVLGRNCQRCLTYLTQALEKSSRPQSLLRGLGVVPHSTTNSSKCELYAPAESGRGVLISMKNPAAKAELAVQHNSNTKHQQHTTYEHNHTNKNATRRRLTQAATVLLENIKYSVEDSGLLTTSPTNESESAQIQRNIPQEATTIAIECLPCGNATRAEAGARAYVRGPKPLSIVLCSNRLSTQDEIDEVLVHELIHIYDVHSRQMDLQECKQLAYSEIRAAREAECSNSLTSFTANICVKDKATVATRNMFPEQGRKCVCDVFDAAMKDLAPFATDFGQPGDNQTFAPPSPFIPSSR